MKLIKTLKTRFWIWFRKVYEDRCSLPYGITRFISNIAFIQMTHEEYIDMAPVSDFAGPWVTTVGARPKLTYATWLEEGGWTYVQVIVELDRGFQVHNELPESREERENILKANRQDELKPVPRPKFGTSDWELAPITDPRVAPLKDVFLAFAFYAPLTAAMKKRLDMVK